MTMRSVCCSQSGCGCRGDDDVRLSALVDAGWKRLVLLVWCRREVMDNDGVAR
jgi:hypothetical protein